MNSKTGILFIAVFFYALVIAVLGIIPSTEGQVVSTIVTEKYTYPYTNDSASQPQQIIPSAANQWEGCACGIISCDVYAFWLGDDYVTNNLCQSITESSLQHKIDNGLIFGVFGINVINNIQDLGWLNTILWTPLLIILGWILLTTFWPTSNAGS